MAPKATLDKFTGPLAIQMRDAERARLGLWRALELAREFNDEAGLGSQAAEYLQEAISAVETGQTELTRLTEDGYAPPRKIREPRQARTKREWTIGDTAAFTASAVSKFLGKFKGDQFEVRGVRGFDLDLYHPDHGTLHARAHLLQHAD